MKPTFRGPYDYPRYKDWMWPDVGYQSGIIFGERETKREVLRHLKMIMRCIKNKDKRLKELMNYLDKTK